MPLLPLRYSHFSPHSSPGKTPGREIAWPTGTPAYGRSRTALNLTEQTLFGHGALFGSAILLWRIGPNLSIFARTPASWHMNVPRGIICRAQGGFLEP
jgi:hypothetical protein